MVLCGEARLKTKDGGEKKKDNLSCQENTGIILCLPDLHTPASPPFSHPSPNFYLRGNLVSSDVNGDCSVMDTRRTITHLRRLCHQYRVFFTAVSVFCCHMFMEDAARIPTSCIQWKVKEERESEPKSCRPSEGVRKETVSGFSFECGED